MAKKKKKDVFAALLSKKTKPKSKSKDKTQMEKINYVLATMRFKHGTIMFVRCLAKRLESGKRLTRGQAETLSNIYSEWIGGRPLKKGTKKPNVKIVARKGK